MTDALTPAQRAADHGQWAADREIIAAATPGEWWVVDADENHGPYVEVVYGVGIADFYFVRQPNGDGFVGFDNAEANAAFLVAAHTRWPAALDDRDAQQARAEKAEAEVARLRSEVAALRDHIRLLEQGT